MTDRARFQLFFSCPQFRSDNQAYDAAIAEIIFFLSAAALVAVGSGAG
jgi:hypothetical protein